MNTLKDYVNFKLTHADKIAEAESYPLTMENCKKYKKMKQLEIYGNSVQDGTPTSDAPVEVQSVGEKSINLATAYDVCKDFDDYTKVIEDGRNCVRYLDSNTTKANPFGFKENTQYTISFDCKLEKGQYGNDTTTPTSIMMVFHYSDGTVGSVSTGDGIALSVRGVWYTKKMTSKAGKTVVGIGTRTYQYQNYNYIDVDTFQVEEGATATPYEPYGKYKIPVVVKGKNLADVRKAFKNFSDYTELEEDGRQCIRVKSNGGAYAFFDFTFKENTQYTISFEFKCKYDRSGVNLPHDCPFAVYYTNGDIDYCSLNPIDGTWNKRTLTTNANKTVSHIKQFSFDYRVYDYIDVNTFQLEEGTVTEYEPYVEPVTTNIFLNEPLRKLGNYADYIDFKNNKVVRKCVKKYLSNYNWMKNNIGEFSNGSYGFYAEDRSIVPDYTGNLPSSAYGFSNVFPITHLTSNWATYTFAIWVATWATNVRIVIPAEYLTEKSVSALKSWLEENNAYMICIRKTPAEEPLNIDLPKLTAKTTIIEVDTNLAPSNAYGKYIKK